MSNEFYKLLETMDQLESGRDLLDPVTETDDQIKAYGYIRLNNGNEFELEGDVNLEDIVAGVRAYGIESIGGEDIGDEAHNLLIMPNGEEVILDSPEKAEAFYSDFEFGMSEDQTKVQTMGNKVKVTKNGDTTEYDDAETAAAMMGDDDKDQFTTEANDSEPVKTTDENGNTEYRLNGKLHREDGPAFINAGGYKQYYINGRQVSRQQMGHYARTGSTDTYMRTNKVQEAEEVAELAPAVSQEQDWDEPDFATFDSEDEAHRRRLQRGTPVVLDRELFKDANCNRRGVFVNRSPSGHFGSVIRDCDGRTVNVHLSDIKSADLVNNSVYEEFDLTLENMLKEDITITQTTNPDAPENDTTTVTAIGADSNAELEAIMANAGIAHGEHASIDAPPVDAGDVDVDVDDGMPLAGPTAELDDEMLSASCMEDDWDDLLSTLDRIDTDTDFDELEPSDTDLMAIDTDPVELEPEMEEGRDIEHANTPDEMTAGTDVMTHGLAGGLNKPKQMYPPAAGGDNPKTVYQEYGLDEEWDDDEDMVEGIDELGRGCEREIGGDAADELLNDIAADEEGMHEGEEDDQFHQGTRIKRKEKKGRDENNEKFFKGTRIKREGEEELDELGPRKSKYDAVLSPNTSKKPAKKPAAEKPSRKSKYDVIRDDVAEDGTDVPNLVKQAAKDYDMGVGTVLRIYNNANSVNEFYDDLEIYIKERRHSVNEEDKPYFVNEHKDVDSFLDLYKEFSNRGEKK